MAGNQPGSQNMDFNYIMEDKLDKRFYELLYSMPTSDEQVIYSVMSKLDVILSDIFDVEPLYNKEFSFDLSYLDSYEFPPTQQQYVNKILEFIERLSEPKNQYANKYDY